MTHKTNVGGLTPGRASVDRVLAWLAASRGRSLRVVSDGARGAWLEVTTQDGGTIRYTHSWYTIPVIVHNLCERAGK